jgi:predicted secreted protein
VSWATIAAIYFLIWWVVLFAVLPWGVRSQEESGDVASGTDPGAPSVPRLLMKVVWTTIVATIVFAAFYTTYVYRLVTVEDLATLFGFPR